MTIEEKREAIKKHCLAHACGECPLAEVTNRTSENCFSEPDEEGRKVGFKPPNIERNYAILFPDKVANPYWERINAFAEKQRAKGMSKYGVGLESNPAAIMERINHLQEELIDGLMYCEWIKDHLSECGDNFTAGDSSLRSE